MLTLFYILGFASFCIVSRPSLIQDTVRNFLKIELTINFMKSNLNSWNLKKKQKKNYVENFIWIPKVYTYMFILFLLFYGFAFQSITPSLLHLNP